MCVGNKEIDRYDRITFLSVIFFEIQLNKIENMEVFKGLKPEIVWEYFEEICKIPRPSKKEEKIAAWLMEFARQHQLEARQDEAGNVLITKVATKGREHVPGVVLQSHMDMVC